MSVLETLVTGLLVSLGFGLLLYVVFTPTTEAQSKPYNAYSVPGLHDIEGIERNTGCLYVVGRADTTLTATYSMYSCPKGGGR